MLRVRSIDILDLGNYSCQAENSQGISRDHIELSGNDSILISHLAVAKSNESVFY